MSKKYDIVAKTGEYQNGQGETKARYLNVGAVMQGQNGPYLLLNKTFNPAGLAEPDRESIILSLLEPRQNDGQQGGRQQQKQPAQQQAPAADYDDTDVPF